MKRPILSLGIVSLLATGGLCEGQGAAAPRGDREVHRGPVHDRGRRADRGPGERLEDPAIYCTDWFVLSDYLKALPRLMDMGRLTEPIVLVGISQPGSTDEWARVEDEGLHAGRPTDDYSKKNIDARAVALAGGASHFIAFLRGELIPRVESEYPVDPARRGFLGYSLGGLLGVQILARDRSSSATS